MKPKYLYVVQFACGLVKVGCTTNPPARINALKHSAPLPVACPSRTRVFEAGSGVAERLVLSAVSRLSTPIAGREWFDAISFEKAVELAGQIVEAEIARQRLRDAELRAGIIRTWSPINAKKLARVRAEFFAAEARRAHSEQAAR